MGNYIEMGWNNTGDNGCMVKLNKMCMTSQLNKTPSSIQAKVQSFLV